MGFLTGALKRAAGSDRGGGGIGSAFTDGIGTVFAGSGGRGRATGLGV